MIYIASPYTTGDKKLLNKRYKRALEYATILTLKDLVPFSPIVHCHIMHLKFRMPMDFRFWMSYNLEMLSRADALHVLMLKGWQSSRGVQAEIKAFKNKSAIHYIQEKDCFLRSKGKLHEAATGKEITDPTALILSSHYDQDGASKKPLS